MRFRMVWFLMACCAASPAAERPPARPGQASFTRKPSASRAGNAVKIDFAVDRETDVAVFVEDGGGKVVRHLVAGVLGNSPPPPLRPGLAQSLDWDGQADYGKPAGPGPFKVRVALGLGAKYDKVLLGDPLSVTNVMALAAAPDGTLCAEISCGGTGAVWGGQQMVAFNRDGTYQRMLMPFPSDRTAAEVKGFEVLELPGGRPVPLVHDLEKRNFYAGYMPRKSGMAVTPDGVVLTLADFNIGALGLDGSAPWGSYLGPRLLEEKGTSLSRRPFIAVSSDGKSAYVSGLTAGEKRSFAAVYRVPLPARGPAEPFFGDPAAAGNDATHLGAGPRGMAADGKGHLLVADHANNRVAVVSEKDGKLAGSFPIDAPDCVATDPSSGAVYVTRLVNRGAVVEVVKFTGWRDAKEAWKLPVKGGYGATEQPWLMALDAGAKPPVLWMGNDGGELLRIEDLGGKCGEPRKITNGALGSCSFVDVSVDRFRPDREIYTRLGQYWWLRYNEDTGKTERVSPGLSSAEGSQIVAAPDGNLYAPGWPHYLHRFDRAGKPLPWETPYALPAGYKLGDGAGQEKNNSIFVPVSMTFLTHTLGIRQDGRIFVFEPAKPGGRPPKALWEYLPSGRRAADKPIIWQVSDTAVGPKFDPQGNIYLLEQIKPAGQACPPEFRELVGDPAKKGRYPPDPRGQVLTMYGSVVKFTPKGGTFDFGGQSAHQGGETKPYQGEPELDPAMKRLDAQFYRGYQSQQLLPAKAIGAEWIHMGASHVDITYCNCENTRFDVDEFGRVFYPDMALFRVGVLDTAGNLICHYGGYGNAESLGPDSRVIDPQTKKVRPRLPTDPKDLKSPFAEPEIAFSWLIGVGVTDRYAYMGDSLNRRLLRARLAYAAEETCPIGP